MGVVCISCIIIAAVTGYFLFQRYENRENQPAHVFHRTVRYGFTIQNTGNRLVKKGLFRTWAPVKRTTTQFCETIDASLPFRIVPDTLGNQALEFVLADIPPHGTKIITITANVSIAAAKGFPEKIDPRSYLSPERYIESDQPSLMQQASSLQTDDPYTTAFHIHNWVSGHLQDSGYIKKNRGALYAYSTQKGDCTEYMYLFIALCRASGIPARGIGGYICRENSMLKPASFHNWAEFYNKDQWTLSDPQNRTFEKGAENYIAMRVLGNPESDPKLNFNRFYLEGEGLSARMN